eukprot:756990-Hanusia_phi.AAC.2
MSPSIIAYHKIKQKLSARKAMGEEDNRTRVAVRLTASGSSAVREEEGTAGSRCVHAPDKQTVHVALPFLNSKEYKFDRVFSEEASDVEVFDSLVAPLVLQVIEGFKCVCVAYGQSGAGKSRTIGTDLLHLETGCVALACRKLFDFMHADACRCAWSLTACCLEIVNDSISDLLEGDPAEPSKGRARSAGIQGLKQVALRSMDECAHLLKIACRRRSKSESSPGVHAHAGHMVLKLSLKRTLRSSEENKSEEHQEIVSSLTFLELLACDKGKSELKGPEALKHMDTSLLHLWSAVHDRQELAHRRESKLLQLASDWLAGRAFTTLIVHVYTSKEYIHETSSSLLLGRRAMLIPVKPLWNDEQVEDANVSRVEEVEHELERLRPTQAEGDAKESAEKRKSVSPKRKKQTPDSRRKTPGKARRRVEYGLAVLGLDSLDAELHEYVEREMSGQETREAATSTTCSQNPEPYNPSSLPLHLEERQRCRRVETHLEDLLGLHSERFRMCFHMANKRWQSFSAIHDSMESFSSLLHSLNDSSRVAAFNCCLQEAIDALAREQLQEGKSEASLGLFARIHEAMLAQGVDWRDRCAVAGRYSSQDVENQDLTAKERLPQRSGEADDLQEGPSELPEAFKTFTTRLLQLQTFQATCALKYCKLSVLGDVEMEGAEEVESIRQLRALLQELESYCKEMNRAEYEKSAGAIVCDLLGQIAVDEKKKVDKLSRLLHLARAQLDEKRKVLNPHIAVLVSASFSAPGGRWPEQHGVSNESPGKNDGKAGGQRETREGGRER